jgi:acyl-CoA thioester hydrolase
MIPGYAFHVSVEAVFGDLDGMGHVNNTVFLRWIETARIAYWVRVTGQKPYPGLPRPGAASHEPGPGIMSGVLIDMILARTEIDYRSPVSYAEKLVVGIRTAEIRRSSILFEYAVDSLTEPRRCADARTVVVCYDYGKQKSRPVPDGLREAIVSLDRGAQVRI